MNKNIKGLLNNLGVFTIANFSTKILNYLILPLYTHYLSTEEYGTIDLVNTLLRLLFPIFSLAISDAVLRFGISDKEKSNQILKIGIRQISIGALPMMLVSVGYAVYTKNYLLSVFVLLLYISEGYNTLFANFSKAINKTKAMAVISVIVSGITLLSNVLMVAGLKLGIFGYLFSVFLGNCIGIILYFFVCDIKRYAFDKNPCTDIELKKQMLAYSIPLIPNAIFWWINSSLDKWTLSIISGLSIVGLYAVANKLPSILSMISTIFSQAWNLSLFQSESSERNPFFKKTFQLYIEIMFCSSLGIIVFSKIFAKFGFSGDFFDAWKFVPILTIGVFFSSLNSVLGSLFTANKDTKQIFRTTLYGSIVNCVMNVPCIILWNAYGAAISTMISYIVVFVIRTIKVAQMYGINIDIHNMIFKTLFLSVISILAVSDTQWVIVYVLTIFYFLYFTYKNYSLLKTHLQNKR